MQACQVLSNSLSASYIFSKVVALTFKVASLIALAHRVHDNTLGAVHRWDLVDAAAVNAFIDNEKLGKSL